MFHLLPCCEDSLLPSHRHYCHKVLCSSGKMHLCSVHMQKRIRVLISDCFCFLTVYYIIGKRCYFCSLLRCRSYSARNALKTAIIQRTLLCMSVFCVYICTYFTIQLRFFQCLPTFCMCPKLFLYYAKNSCIFLLQNTFFMV